MCEYCHKYKCPSGCPNNYRPSKRKKDRANEKISWNFDVIHILPNAEQDNNEIRSKEKTKEEDYGKDLGFRR